MKIGVDGDDELIKEGFSSFSLVLFQECVESCQRLKDVFVIGPGVGRGPGEGVKGVEFPADPFV